VIYNKEKTSEYQPTLHTDGKKWNAKSECSEFLHFLHFYIVVEHSNEPTERVLHPGTRWCLKACAIKQVTLFPALNTLPNSASNPDTSTAEDYY
jgi:hypothetical protein